MSELLKLPPEPGEEHSSDAILDNLRSGHPVVVEGLTKVFHEIGADDLLSILAKKRKTTDSCNEDGQTTRESNDVVHQSPLKYNRDQKVVNIPNDIVENLKSGHSVNVKMLMEILHDLSAETALSIFSDETELETGCKRPVMVQQITPPVRQRICQLLNVTRTLGNDFRTLGGELGLSNEDMQRISGKENPADEVLKMWETQLIATVEAFRVILKRMKRDDVVDVLEGNRKPGDEYPPMVREMNYLVRMSVCKKLNVRRDLGGDFKNLAGELGMSIEDVQLISDKDDRAEEVITWWETRNSATIEAFRCKLLKIERSDIEEIVREASQVISNCTVQKLSRIGEQMQCRTVFSLPEIVEALTALGLLKKTKVGWSFKTENSTELCACRNSDVSSSGEANGYQEEILGLCIAVSFATVCGLVVNVIPICQWLCNS